MMTEHWPELRQSEWQQTQATVHRWTQIVGKIRLNLEPLINHWWNVALYVTPCGLTTSPMVYENRSFAIDFDFIGHHLLIEDSNGARTGFALEPMTVADFYAKLMTELRRMDIDVRISRKPNEIPNALPLDEDTENASYDAKYVERFQRILRNADTACKRFRADFLGKVSPVHFFWGSFDLATTRFSGRSAPQHPGGIPNLPDDVTREAYSHEEHSIGFWPGGMGMEAAFYAYAYPAPDGFAEYPVQPAVAGWNDTLREFLLPYDAVRESATPEADLQAFFQSTYEATANLGGWNRAELERRAITTIGT